MQEKNIKTAAIPCPICDGKLRGSYQAGYKCSHCYAHFTGMHTVWLTKNHLRTQIDAHFSNKKEIETTRVIIEQTPVDDIEQEQPDKAVITLNPSEQKLSILISETHDAANKSTQHLEDMLEVQQEVHEKIEKTKATLEKKSLKATREKPTTGKNITKKRTKQITKLFVKPRTTTIKILNSKQTKKPKPTKKTISSKSRTAKHHKKATRKTVKKSIKKTTKKIVKKKKF